MYRSSLSTIDVLHIYTDIHRRIEIAVCIDLSAIEVDTHIVTYTYIHTTIDEAISTSVIF